MTQRTSAEWSQLKAVAVTDPDGWNRKDFDNAWNESITEKEFDRRAALSTTITLKSETC